MARRTTPAHEPLTLDRVVGHWAFKALIWALIPLCGYVVTEKLESIDRRLEAAGAVTAELKTGLDALREDLAEIRDENKSTASALQLHSSRVDRLEGDHDRLKLRVDELEAAAIRARHGSYEDALQAWQQGHEQWQQAQKKPKKP